MIGPAAEHAGHLLSCSVASKLTVRKILGRPFCQPMIEEGVRTALRNLIGALGCGPNPPARCTIAFQLAQNRVIAGHWVKDAALANLAERARAGLSATGRRKPGDADTQKVDPSNSPVSDTVLVVMGPAEPHEIVADRCEVPTRKRGRHGGH